MPSSHDEDPQRPTTLVALTGLSPAVLTETLWALACRDEAIIPERVIVITTTVGRSIIQDRLFTPSPACAGKTPWDALRGALIAAGHSLEGKLRFGPTGDDIRVMVAADPDSGINRELDDIRNPADNLAAADFILETLRSIVEHPDQRLVASLAGGRKTMAALLGSAMHLIADEDDLLTHVLVSEPFESIPDFWFPAQGNLPLSDRNGQIHLPSTARLDLAEVPFVPLRNLFLDQLGRPSSSYPTLIANCRRSVRAQLASQLELEVDLLRRRVRLDRRPLELSSREILLLGFYASQAKFPPLRPANVFADLLQDLVDWIEQLLDNPATTAVWSALAANLRNLDEDDLRKITHTLRTKFRLQPGSGAVLAAALPRRGQIHLALPPESIILRLS